MDCEFTIRFEVDGVRNLAPPGVMSPITIAQDISWSLNVATENSKRTGNVNHLAMFLYCNEDSELEHWTVDCTTVWVLLNGGIEKKKGDKKANHFGAGKPFSRGHADFIRFNELISNANGYLNGDKITIECRVNMVKVTGIEKRVVHDFQTSMNGINNVVLKIGDNKLNVSRDLLSIHSPVLAEKFSEGTEDGIMELNDIVCEQFADFLNTIYPTTFEIKAINVEHILALADRFKVTSVVDRVISYFMKTDKFNSVSKLKIAEKYGLQELTDFCLRSIKNVADLKTIKATAEYNQLPDSLRATICEKIFEF